MQGSAARRASGRTDQKKKRVWVGTRRSRAPGSPSCRSHILACDPGHRCRAERTQEAYTRYVCDLARYYRRSPELISYEEVRDWLYHLIKERKQSTSSVNIVVNAVRFLYGVTLGRDTAELMASVPHTKCATRRAEVYARSEVEAILTTPKQPRERVFLMEKWLRRLSRL